MPRTSARFTQADVARIIRAARQAGASEVEVKVGAEDSIVIRLAPSTGSETPLAPIKESVL